MRLDDFRDVARLVAKRADILDMHDSLYGMASAHCTLVPHHTSIGKDALRHCEEYWLREVLAAKYKELVADIDKQLIALGVVIE
jgi:hypothetical protein